MNHDKIEICCRVLSLLVGGSILTTSVMGYRLWGFAPVVAVILGIIGIVFLGKAVDLSQ